MEIRDVIIVGLGPAGLNAGIYLKRFGLNPLAFESYLKGGKVNFTSEVGNYLGLPTSGVELAEQFTKHYDSYQIETKSEQVTEVSLNDDGTFKVVTDGGAYTSKAVLLSIGMKERFYDLRGAEKFKRRGISTCAVCDGPLYKNKPVAVIGGGNSALEEAIYLASICSSVALIHRRDEFRADQQLVDEVKKLSNIHIYTPFTGFEASGTEKIQTFTIQNVNTHELVTLDIECLFTYVGASPIADFLKIENVLDSKGFVETNDVMESKIPGLYGAGDCRNTSFRQIATAISDGALAALSINKYLKGIK